MYRSTSLLNFHCTISKIRLQIDNTCITSHISSLQQFNFIQNMVSCQDGKHTNCIKIYTIFIKMHIIFDKFRFYISSKLSFCKHIAFLIVEEQIPFPAKKAYTFCFSIQSILSASYFFLFKSFFACCNSISPCSPSS